MDRRVQCADREVNVRLYEARAEVCRVVATQPLAEQVGSILADHPLRRVRHRGTGTLLATDVWPECWRRATRLKVTSSRETMLVSDLVQDWPIRQGFAASDTRSPLGRIEASLRGIHSFGGALLEDGALASGLLAARDAILCLACRVELVGALLDHACPATKLVGTLQVPSRALRGASRTTRVRQCCGEARRGRRLQCAQLDAQRRHERRVDAERAV